MSRDTYKDNYDTFMRLTKPVIKSYDRKLFNDESKYYSNRLTNREKDKIKSRYYYEKNPITIKEVLLTIIILILIFLLIFFNAYNLDSIILVCFLILFFFIAVAFNYNVNSKFYIFYLGLYFVIIIIVLYLNSKYIKIEDLKNNIKNNVKNNTKK